jgi:hypothetical protein
MKHMKLMVMVSTFIISTKTHNCYEFVFIKIWIPNNCNTLSSNLVFICYTVKFRSLHLLFFFLAPSLPHPLRSDIPYLPAAKKHVGCRVWVRSSPKLIRLAQWKDRHVFLSRIHCRSCKRLSNEDLFYHGF